MREFFSSWRFKILALVALLLLGLMLRAATTAGFSTVTQSVVSVIAAPVQKLSAAVSGAATGALTDIASYVQAKKENEQLKKQIQQLNSKIVNYDSVMLQNQQYKEYLGLKEVNPDMKFISAMVISRDPGQWFSSFSVDKGSMEGIRRNDTVITADGVVGIVTQVLPTSSVVTTILDPSVQVASIISRTGDVCTSQGSNDLLSAGELEQVHIDKDSSVARGDIVITSGIGGIFPKGLKISTVTDIKMSSNGVSLIAVSQPMVNPSSVKYVFIVTDFKGKTADSVSSEGGD